MNLIDNLSSFFGGNSEAKVVVGVDSTSIVKAGIIVIITVALSVLIFKMFK